MTQGRSGSSTQDVLTESELSKITESLTSELITIEEEMIKAKRGGKKKLSSTSRENYSVCINDLVARLRNIASVIFHETEIEGVKPYKPTDKIPQNYSKYLRASENLSRLVAQNVLYQPDAAHALVVFERWLHICKTAFHRHDFFTASCIMQGLLNQDIKLTYKKKDDKGATHNISILHKKTQLVFNYYSMMLSNLASLYPRQNALSSLKLEVIPLLHSLPSVYGKLDFKVPNDKSAAEKQKAEMAVKRRTVSKNFSQMKKKNPSQLELRNNNILASLYKAEDKEIEEGLSVRSKILTENIKLRPTDWNFSISNFADLFDARVRLIEIETRIQSIEDNYDKKITFILSRVRNILKTPDLTDREMYGRINEQFDFSDVKFDIVLKKIHREIKSILILLIKFENEHGIFLKEKELKVEDSSKKAEKAVKGEKKEKLKRPPKIKSQEKKKMSDSTTALEERTPKIKDKKEEDKTLSETESTLSRVDVVPKPLEPVVLAPKLALPDISSSARMINSFNERPLQPSDSMPSSVRSELNVLRPAMSSARLSYLKLFPDQTPLKGSQSARVEKEVSKEAVLSDSSRVGVKSSKQ